MKSLCIFIFCMAAVFAAPQLHDANHYATHELSVATARRGASSRLENYSADTQKNVPNENYICNLCQSGHGSSSSDYQHSKNSHASSHGYIVPSTSGRSSSSSSASEFSSSSHDASIPVIVPGGSESRKSFNSHLDHERFSSQHPVSPNYIYPSGESSNSHYSSNQYKQDSHLNQNVIPVSGGHSHSHTETRFSDVRSTQSTPYVYPVSSGYGSNSQKSSFLESHSSQAVPTVTYTVPSSDRSSSYARQSESFRNQGTGQYVVPIATYPDSQSSHSSKISEQSVISSGNAGYPRYVVHPSSRSQFDERSSSSSSTGQYGGQYVLHPLSGQDLSSRYRSSSDFGSSYRNSNLGQYMTESERLARLQAQNIQGHDGYKATQTVDLGNAALINTPSTGARSKSWEKSSKWGSQSEYDSRGVTKSSGFLSTAEGEDTTLNGKTTGYRAATTTVEDNGKQSTYSIHTP